MKWALETYKQTSALTDGWIVSFFWSLARKFFFDLVVYMHTGCLVREKNYVRTRLNPMPQHNIIILIFPANDDWEYLKGKSGISFFVSFLSSARVIEKLSFYREFFIMDFSDEPPPVLLPCSICTRTFRPEVLERHTKICEKSATKKRRPFDSFKSRVSGTELEEFLGPAALPGQPIKKPPERSPQKKPARGPPKWKETHESLIAVLRAARGENGNVPNVNKHAGKH